jgi:hypothetical protein
MRPFWVETDDSLDIARGFHGVLKGQNGAVEGMMGIPSVLAMSDRQAFSSLDPVRW